MKNLEESDHSTERTTWRRRLLLAPQLRHIENWPDPNLSRLSPERLGTYVRRRKAVACILQGRPVKNEAEWLKCSVHEVYRLLDRCLGSKNGEEPPLSLGLIPELRIAGREGGKFNRLQQEYPGVFAALRKLIDEILRKKPGTPRYNEHQFSTKFIDLLIAEGVEADGYPFCAKGLARESLRKWRRKTELEILANRTPSRAHQYALLSDLHLDVMDCFQLDGHLHDFEAGTLFDLGDNLVSLRIGRFWIILLVEQVSTAILGWSWGFSKNVRTDDILECLDRTTSIWTPYEDLPAGLAYPPGGGVPSMHAAFQHAVPYMLKMDNAWAHFADDVREHLHKTWNCVVNWGRPAFPVARRVVEMAISRLATFEHQFPSTSGNSPWDPRRDPHRDRVPNVPFSHIAALIDVCIAEINARPRPDLLNCSPLEVLRSRAANGLIIRTLPEQYRRPGQAFRVRREVSITGNPAQGKPMHINFCYEPYRGTVLQKLVSQGASHALIEYDRRDIRSLDVLDRSGRSMGSVSVGGVWARFPHDERLRSAVYQEAIANRWSRCDALTKYFEEVKNYVHSPSEALRLVDIASRVIGKDDRLGLPAPREGQQSLEAMDEPPSVSAPLNRSPVDWAPDFPLPKDE